MAGSLRRSLAGLSVFVYFARDTCQRQMRTSANIKLLVDVIRESGSVKQLVVQRKPALITEGWDTIAELSDVAKITWGPGADDLDTTEIESTFHRRVAARGWRSA